MDHLTGLLAYAAEREKRALRNDAGLFLELAPCGVEQLLAFIHHALGNGPGTSLAVAPEWAARMSEEHLEIPLPAPVEQQSGTEVRAAGPAERLAQCASAGARLSPRGFWSRRMAGDTTRKQSSNSIHASL